MAARRVVIAMASPRKDGNSTILAHKVADGATAAGAEVELFKLHEMDIKPCDGCDACQQKKSKGCCTSLTAKLSVPDLKAQPQKYLSTKRPLIATLPFRQNKPMNLFYGISIRELL